MTLAAPLATGQKRNPMESCDGFISIHLLFPFEQPVQPQPKGQAMNIAAHSFSSFAAAKAAFAHSDAASGQNFPSPEARKENDSLRAAAVAFMREARLTGAASAKTKKVGSGKAYQPGQLLKIRGKSFVVLAHSSFSMGEETSQQNEDCGHASSGARFVYLVAACPLELC